MRSTSSRHFQPPPRRCSSARRESSLDRPGDLRARPHRFCFSIFYPNDVAASPMGIQAIRQRPWTHSTASGGATQRHAKCPTAPIQISQQIERRSTEVVSSRGTAASIPARAFEDLILGYIGEIGRHPEVIEYNRCSYGRGRAAFS